VRDVMQCDKIAREGMLQQLFLSKNT